jgi:chromosome segregation ATPase
MRSVCTLAAVAAVANAANPVTRVVTLLNELKAKIEADGKGEQKIYDKFACWCEQTTARKAAAISTAKEHIEELTTEIQKRKGQLGSLSAELAQLKKDLANNQASQKDAKSLRTKENRGYVQTKNEMEQAIGALETAINALSGAGMTNSLIAKQAKILEVAADLRGALEMAPRGIITSEQADGVRGFFSNPGSFAQTTAGGVDSYAPASGEIVGILKDMFQTFTANLETAAATEADNQKIFEDLMAAKEKEESDLQFTLDAKEAENAEATTVEAESQEDREDTTTQLNADQTFFDETKKDCREKADDWATRTRLRTEELAGIEKAVEILTSPEAQAAFEGASNTFVQVEVKPSSARVRAYNALKRISRGNAQLSLLAARVATGTGWEFGKVDEQIDKMIENIRKEEKEDVAAKDNCDEMENKAKAKKNDLQSEINTLTNQINKLNTRKANNEQGITDTINDMEAQKQMMEAALSSRNVEHEKFVDALKDDEAAVALLGQAMEALASYEKNNKDALGLLQSKKSKKGPEGQPEYTIDEDKAPDASFSGGKKHDSESKGIVGIIEMIKEDLENEIKQEKQKEADDQAEYERQLADDKEAMKALAARKVDLEEEIAEIEEKIAAKQSDKKNTENDKSAAQDTLDKLKPSCDWVAQTFETRRANRASELADLMEAKAVLNGASQEGGASEEGESAPPAFLQRHQ